AVPPLPPPRRPSPPLPSAEPTPPLSPDDPSHLLLCLRSLPLGGKARPLLLLLPSPLRSPLTRDGSEERRRGEVGKQPIWGKVWRQVCDGWRTRRTVASGVDAASGSGEHGLGGSDSGGRGLGGSSSGGRGR
ncbi:unnamed protein product, partial [Urochloa humidicola]